MTVLVTGGTGFVGREVVRQLVAAGHNARILARNRTAAADRLKPISTALEIRTGDVLRPESLRGVADECNAVIHLVGIISEIGEQTFENVHLRATQNVLAEANRAGVKRWIHMSALGTRPNAASRYHQTKWAAEEAVRASELDWTILRPSVIYGPEDHFVNLFAGMARRSPLIPVIGSGQTRLQPVSVQAVARCFVGALTEPRSIGQTIDVCGPESLTQEALIDAVLQVTGKNRRKLHLPLPLARFQARMFETIFPTLLRKAAPLTRDQLVMMLEDNAGNPAVAEDLFGLRQESFVQGIGRYLK